MGRIPSYPPTRLDQILLSRPAGLVVPPAIRHSFRKAKKGPLADVLAPHLVHHPHHFELLHELYSNRYSRSCVYGFL